MAEKLGLAVELSVEHDRMGRTRAPMLLSRKKYFSGHREQGAHCHVDCVGLRLSNPSIQPIPHLLEWYRTHTAIVNEHRNFVST
jgi:hypothetical protein